MGLHTRLVLWVVVCLVVALWLRARPMISMIIALAIWTLIPGVVTSQITGVPSGSLAFHAATWLILATFLANVITNPRGLGEVFARRFIIFLSVLIVICAGTLATKTGDAQHGVVPLVDEMLAPFLGFWVISTALRERPEQARWLRNAIIVMATVEAIWAFIQYLAGNVILYGGFYIQKYWFTPTWDRWMGTTDHPLVLSLLICGAIPLLTGLRRAWLQPVLLVVMLVAVVITQSRSGVVAAGLATVYVLLASRTSSSRKAVMSIVLVLGSVWLATSSLSTGVVDRVQNDTGSTLARGSAWQYYLDNWQHYLVAGGGLNASYNVAAQAGLDSSFESAFLMYSIDIGLVFSVLYFAVQLVLVLRTRRVSIHGAWLSALVVIGLCQTFNSLEVETLVGPFLWTFIALAAEPALPGDRARRGADQPDRSAEPVVSSTKILTSSGV
jgi:O-Antigen ligase